LVPVTVLSEIGIAWKFTLVPVKIASGVKPKEVTMSRLNVISLVVLILSLSVVPGWGEPLDQYVQEAGAYRQAGDLEKAAATMEKAIAEYPDSAIVYAYLGLYKGMQAGATDNFMEAGRLSQASFDLLDKAVTLDPDNARARLYRGLMGVKVPQFMGRLPGAMDDLNTVLRLHAEDPENVSPDLVVTAYNLLGEGYAKMGDDDKAVSAWEKVVELAPDSPEAVSAHDAIARLAPAPPPAEPVPGRSVEELQKQVKAHPEDATILAELGKAYLDAGDIEKAEAVLRQAIELDPNQARAYRWLAEALGRSMSGGEIYDERIHQDTDWATRLAFEMVEMADKAVELAPKDLENRLFRGIVDVQMPFFTGKLDQGIADLDTVMASDAGESLKAQAAYWLGYAYQKKSTTYWTKVLTEYNDEQAAQLALESMRPPVQKLDLTKVKTPAVAVDFTLGFRDELPPQTAVWVETPDGDFVKTLYVSGFSGHAREAQVVLPVWAATSDFAGADAVTAASINTGEHVYVWDLRNQSGEKVQPGEYVVKVETHFWPSMKYEAASATVAVGGDQSQVVTQEGKFIPFLELIYLP
jgi:tetratricopeptide (TPR) repeat protein